MIHVIRRKESLVTKISKFIRFKTSEVDVVYKVL